MLINHLKMFLPFLKLDLAPVFTNTFTNLFAFLKGRSIVSGKSKTETRGDKSGKVFFQTDEEQVPDVFSSF